MKIALIYTFAPFIKGGTEILISDLEAELIKRNCDVDVYSLPCSFQTLETITESMVNMKFLRFDDYDKVIISKFPCFYIEHKNIKFWIFHQFRQVYELFGTEFFSFNNKSKAFKDIVVTNDNKLRGREQVLTICDEVSNRLVKYNNIQSEVLYPPISNTNGYYKGFVGNYLYYPSRVNSFKRQLLAVQSMKYVKSDAELIISGVSESKEYQILINDFVNQNRLQHKVKFVDRWVTDKEKYDFYANSLGCLYTTLQEDYGYITLEAFYSHKPVITCSDSGGPTHFVEDNKTGYVTEPTPESIAEAIDKLYNDKINAEQMGENAYEFIVKKNINWEDTIKRLLA